MANNTSCSQAGPVFPGRGWDHGEKRPVFPGRAWEHGEKHPVFPGRALECDHQQLTEAQYDIIAKNREAASKLLVILCYTIMLLLLVLLLYVLFKYVYCYWYITKKKPPQTIPHFECQML